MLSPFYLQEYCYLYRYFASTLLTRLVRHESLARYTYQTYMLRLALEFPPFMGTLISIAGMQLNSPPRWAVHCPVKSYVQTLMSLWSILKHNVNIGSEDATQASVISLSVFEVWSTVAYFAHSGTPFE